MTIILFLIDTSASMCQKAYVNGVQKSYLDVAKGAVETFLKYRQRSQDCLGDRYMLLTFDEPPSNVKAGWKENHATFMNELKNLQSTGLTTMGEALKNALDLLNLNRMQSGIDTYGQGRCPFYLESSVIIVITDGGKYTFRNGVQQEIILPLNAQIPGTKFTKEPFRWDQRLFSLVLRMSGNKIDERAEGKVPHDDSHIERMCEVTGGRSYRVKSHCVLNQCIESLVQKVQPGVVLHFEPLIPKDLKDGEVQDLSFQTTKKMIYVLKHPTQKTFPVGYWPLPESYWPDPKAASLPPRDAHPKIRVMTPSVDEPQIVRNFPVDKYDIEASPLTLQILSKRDPNKCWPVTIANGIHGFEAPFGYLKPNLTFTQVYLFVLAYNYPVLLPLLHDLIHFHKFVQNPPNDWMYKFSGYIRSIPQYYCPFLRRVLLAMNVPFPLLSYILPDNMDNFLSPNVANYLKQIKNSAKQDQENLCLRIYRQLKQAKPPYRQVEMVKINSGPPLRRDVIRNPMLRDTFLKLHSDISVFENYNIIIPTLTRQPSAKNYRNPFDIPRRDLIDEIARMRSNFLKASSTSGINLATKDSGHCLPIAEMGNYQEYLKNKENPLREIEPTNVRQHMFGNPYKKDKHMVMVDEADLGDVAPIKPNQNSNNAPKKGESSRLRKRKAGPIRKDFIFRRLSTDSQQSSNYDSEDDTSSECSDFEDNPVSEPTPYDFYQMEDNSNNGMKNLINAEDLVEKIPDVQFDSTAQPAEASPIIDPDYPLVNIHPATDNRSTTLVNNSSNNNCSNINIDVSKSNNDNENDESNNDNSGDDNNINNDESNNNSSNNNNECNNDNNNDFNNSTENNNEDSNNSNITNYENDNNSNSNENIIENININANISNINYDVSTNNDNDDSNSNSPNYDNDNNENHDEEADDEVDDDVDDEDEDGNNNNNNDVSNNNNSNNINYDNDNSNNYENSIDNININNNNTNNNNTANSNSNSSTVTNSNNQDNINSNSTNTVNSNSINNQGVINLYNQSPYISNQQKENHNIINLNGSSSSVAHNDINDAQEISKILQQCHIESEQNNKDVFHHHNSNCDKQATESTNEWNIKKESPPTNAINNNNDLEEQQLTEEDKEKIYKNNLDTRKLIFNDIRRPGRDYSKLVEHLNLMQGNLEIKFDFLQMCINESLRFRRKRMAEFLQEWGEKHF